MANTPIVMSKLRQIVKLYYQGQSKLQISTFTGISRNTIKKYLHILTALKTTWEEVTRLSDKDLDDLFCKVPERVVDERLAALHDYLNANEKRLKKRGITLHRLWEEYFIAHEALTYSQRRLAYLSQTKKQPVKILINNKTKFM